MLWGPPINRESLSGGGVVGVGRVARGGVVLVQLAVDDKVGLNQIRSLCPIY